jgi:Mor family transcriptional regulator
MVVRRLSAKEIIQDILSGMDETTLRKKYQLSLKGLETLYQKLISAGLLGKAPQLTPRKINLLAVLADIRAGMSQPDLLKKYGISESVFRQLTKKLLAAQGIRLATDAETVIMEPFEFPAGSELVTHEVDFDLPAYEADRPDTHGMVREVSEESMSVAGIEAAVGDTKTLVVLGDELGQFSSFEFDGSCLWSFVDAEEGTCLAGFAIIKISKADAQELRKLLRVLTSGG